MDRKLSLSSVDSDSMNKQLNNSIKSINTTKFLKTNIEEYLKKEEDPKDDATYSKHEKQLLQFKYSNHMKSNYKDNYKKHSDAVREKPFNPEKQKSEIKG